MITHIIVKTHPVLMPSSKHCKPSRELRRALKGALAMARDRGYVMSGDNPLLTPPPRDSKTFFRSFPAHFDVTDRLGQQVIRFEFWNKPLSQLPGQEGQVVAKRVRRAARRTGVPLTRVRLVLLVPQHTHRQERQERRALKTLGAHLEVFQHQFFSRRTSCPPRRPANCCRTPCWWSATRTCTDTWAICPRLTPTTSGAATWAPRTATFCSPAAAREACAPCSWWCPPAAPVTTTPGRQSSA
ncbi:hypothetical protein GWK47_021456 [Chionoecetes opilio]|uniref:Uncharacterized protein n=1 Tax=Chionoecetes opilio TaxID=41210 RepID=A0A8J4XNK7_CHIOP|nr:hypothetical protein GWK47_021456 [Chionoecetes opilio]